MTWTNYHTHCHFCDGREAPEAYVAAARRLGVRALGFSSHAPVPFETDWTMKPERLAEYVRTIRGLQAREVEAGSGSAPLSIHLGLEIDYIPGVMGRRSPQFQSLGLDYAIGSVHFIEPLPSGLMWTVDGPDEEFRAGLEHTFGGDVRAAVEEYYRRIREMLRREPPDILAHLDIVKKNNWQPGAAPAARPAPRYFSEEADWYRAAVGQTLDAIADTGVIVEVNTGGLARGRANDLYPSEWILREMARRGLPITLTSDCHQPDQLTALFPETSARLRAIGFKEIQFLAEGRWRGGPFDATGLRCDGAPQGRPDFAPRP